MEKLTSYEQIRTMPDHRWSRKIFEWYMHGTSIRNKIEDDDPTQDEIIKCKHATYQNKRLMTATSGRGANNLTTVFSISLFLPCDHTHTVNELNVRITLEWI